MNGLTVRWSLVAAPAGVEDALASYVAETSHARFSVMPGLRFKTWRCVPGQWFEGCYVFADDAARAALKPLEPGSFYTEPPSQPHFAMTKDEVIIQVSGVGPSSTTYVDLANDPTRR